MPPAMPPSADPAALDITLIQSGTRGMAWLSTLTGPEALALGVRLTGVCDLNPATSATAVPARLPDGCITGHDLTAALALRAQVVIDATSPVTRLAVTREAMQTGAHVLCDPPLALDVETAVKLIGAAARGPGRLAVAHLSRHRHGLSQLRTLAADGRMGRPLTLHVHLTAGDDTTPQGLLGASMADAFDAGRAILGADGASVSCSVHPFRAAFQMANAAGLILTTGLGPEHWRLEMEGGTVTCGAAGPAILADGTPVDDAPPRSEGRLGALAHFVGTIRAGRAPEIGPRSAASSLAMALAAHASARRGGELQTVLHLGLMSDASDMPNRRGQPVEPHLAPEVP